MSDQMKEGGVKCMGLITLLPPITTLAVVKQRPFSVSEPAGVWLEVQHGSYWTKIKQLQGLHSF